ncbi:hypothetical protein M9H77_17536 [Catharanthus roseus]|uniref:Uncharacterized protein n=1 Tax=Catharanthus roseus TaxID=4058 RepID=A0ACC0B4V6_CATRO|nr:hypothetical protein M9H77_17536 [Catharanthus roseus]
MSLGKSNGNIGWNVSRGCATSYASHRKKLVPKVLHSFLCMGLKSKERLSSFSQFVQLARIIQENKVEVKKAKYWRRAPTADSSPVLTAVGRLAHRLEEHTLPRLVGSTLSSPHGFKDQSFQRRGRCINVIIMYGMKNYQREYDAYHEGYDHDAHTHEGYNVGAYGGNDGDGKWRYPRSMNAFDGNRSYGDEPMVERRFVDSGGVVGVEDRRSVEKELDPIPEHLLVSIFLSPSSLCYKVSLEELKSFVGFLYFSNDTSLVEINIVGFALEFDRNSLQHVCSITSTRGRRYTMEFEGQGKNVGGKLILCYGDLIMSFSSN